MEIKIKEIKKSIKQRQKICFVMKSIDLSIKEEREIARLNFKKENENILQKNLHKVVIIS